MRSFDKKMAVVSGGGTGIGRELVVQLAAEGCAVATCDVRADALTETARRATGAKVTTHACDVSDETQVLRFRDEVVTQHTTDHVNLVFNNAGIIGGGSFIKGNRTEWERTFGVDWWGVYYCSRAFVPLLIKSDEGYLVNTSSVNGLWAADGPDGPNNAYTTAKFAVRGFSEALIADFRFFAPHVKVAAVMPGHIGTDIVINSRRIHGQPDAEQMSSDDLDAFRDLLVRFGIPADQLSDDDLRKEIAKMGDRFRDDAPQSAAQAATAILDGLRADRWRILVGEDAHAIDRAIRADPEGAYNSVGPNATPLRLGGVREFLRGRLSRRT